MKRIAILGSTGSIGANVLRVVEAHDREFSVSVLAARRNAELLYRQAKKFRPKLVCLFEDREALALERRLRPYKIKVVTGEDGLIQASTFKEVDRVIFSIVGAVGLKPLLASLEIGKSVAIASKEPLVIAGDLVNETAGRNGVQLIPIDSEHSGLWQCLEGKEKTAVKKLILTSSGGPFFDRKVDFKTVSPREALRHPRWKMGPKITIDSATLMNKGLEVIEAANLFEVSSKTIEVLIHPEAVVHALVEFVDGSQLAQLGITDMRLPIQYALGYPARLNNTIPSLDLTRINSFHFFKPDLKRFPCLRLGYEAACAGGTMPAVLNAANEVAVERYLNGSIHFNSIPIVIERVMKRHKIQDAKTLDKILNADRWARSEAGDLCPIS